MVAHWNQPVVVSYVAGGDLSAKQYHFVKLNSAGAVVAVAAITDIPVGVLQNNPASGETAEVAVMGGSKLVASAAITLPAVVGTAADGKAVKLTPGTSTTAFVLGQADVAAGGANEVISVLINCASPARAA